MASSEREFDYIVVGAGAAGSVVAARLSEDSTVRVAVFEAGGFERSPLLTVPGANVITGTHEAYNWNYRTEPVPELAGRRLYWAQGRLVGGSSAINGMMYMRGRARDYENWRALGCEGWGFADVLAAFRKSEANERGETALHGGDGPLQVSRGHATAPVYDLFLAATERSGYPVVDDLNADHEEAFGHVDLTIGNGRRSSAASAFLIPSLHRHNLSLHARASVTRVLTRGGAAIGIEYVQDNERRVARAAREVILCGGAVNSPQLLMLSGIGEGDALRRLGISVVADRPAVGRNLQNHPMVRLMYTTTKPVTAYRHARPLGAMKAGLRYALSRSGVLSRGLFPTSGYFLAEEGDASTEIQVCMAPALVIRRRLGLLGILPKEEGFTLLLNHGSPFSRGEVRLLSADPFAHAGIHANFFSDPRDLPILARGMARMREIVRSAPLSEYLGREIHPQGPVSSLADLITDIRATATTHYHAAGTCRMGRDADSVVDPVLRVRGVERLRVADTSIMPVLINGNTCAAAMMIGERASNFIQGKETGS